MKILIAGDLYIDDQFQNKKLIDKSIEDFFNKVDYRIVNLEAPLTNDRSENKIIKTGPHLRMSKQTAIPYIKQLNIDGVTLANNHILDYSSKGLTDTFEVLKKQQIEYVGAGHNLLDASKPLTIEADGKKIAILNFCEKEWSIAKKDTPGANPMNILDISNNIKEAKVNHNKVICILHGGHENYQLPSKRMVFESHEIIDAGADLIVWHHTHCYSGFETYNGKQIFYGLGNFHFTRKNKNQFSNVGLILTVELSKNKEIINKEFVYQNPDNYGISLLKKNDLKMHDDKFKELSNIITDNNLFKYSWINYIERSKQKYLFMISPFYSVKNKYLKYIILKLNLPKIYFSKRRTMIFLSLLRCDAHRELLEDILHSEIEN